MNFLPISNINFGAKISAIPRLDCINKKEIELKDASMKGYTAFIGGDVYTPSNKIVKQDLLFKDNKLVAIDDFDENKVGENINYIICDDKTIAPAVLDEHIHGGFGVDFNSSSEKDMRKLLRKLKEQGVGGVIATTLPGHLEHVKERIKEISKVIENPEPDAAKIYGIHLEGPFFSEEKLGVHSKKDLSAPTIENYEKLEPKHVSIVTVAPEIEGGKELSHYLLDHGVIPSAGHSDAMAKDLEEADIPQVTHVFNAMRGFHHRNMSISNEALWNDKISVEMIPQANHLDPKVMDIVHRVKPDDKIVLISDALPNAGIKENFIMNGKKIIVSDNWDAKDENGTIAGNMEFLPTLAKKLSDTTSIKFKDFIRYSSVNPSTNLGIQEDFQLKEGATPNFTVWNNKTLSAEKTFVK